MLLCLHLPTDVPLISHPAQRAGVCEGDVIVGYGSHVIASIDDLQRLKTEEQVGMRSEVTLLRRNDGVARLAYRRVGDGVDPYVIRPIPTQCFHNGLLCALARC